KRVSAIVVSGSLLALVLRKWLKHLSSGLSRMPVRSRTLLRARSVTLRMLSLPGPGAGVVRNGLKLRVGRLRAALGGTRLITLLRASLAGTRRRRTLLLRLLVWASSLTPRRGL